MAYRIPICYFSGEFCKAGVDNNSGKWSADLFSEPGRGAPFFFLSKKGLVVIRRRMKMIRNQNEKRWRLRQYCIIEMGTCHCCYCCCSIELALHLGAALSPAFPIKNHWNSNKVRASLAEPFELAGQPANKNCRSSLFFFSFWFRHSIETQRHKVCARNGFSFSDIFYRIRIYCRLSVVVVVVVFTWKKVPAELLADASSWTEGGKKKEKGGGRR